MLIVFDSLSGNIIFDRDIYLIDEYSIWILGTGIWDDEEYWDDDAYWDDGE